MQLLSFKLRCKLSPPPSTTSTFNIHHHQLAIMKNKTTMTTKRTMKTSICLPQQQQHMR
ncbi:hypothetical protein DY000_02021498 [Brassica cretica]|uniref:Uncharacterized protein n=1 Tax=Brassica cretica TaxID=69181 RepID=A0ABQ7E352_BRACR|nr:hypothetical protein DY000_02021498 [Brassica cretica]